MDNVKTLYEIVYLAFSSALKNIRAQQNTATRKMDYNLIFQATPFKFLTC